MKKKIRSMVLIAIMLVGAMFLLAGCGKQSTNDDIESYLNRKYKDESFKILSEEKIDNISGSSNSGHRYTVKSNDTNIEFFVEDIYVTPSGGISTYDLGDNYKIAALIKYINDFGDNRINIDTHMNNSDIKIEYNEFDTVEELAKTLYNFKNFYESRKPFTQEASFSVMVFIYKNGEYKKAIDLSYYNKEEITESDLKNDILKLE